MRTSCTLEVCFYGQQPSDYRTYDRTYMIFYVSMGVCETDETDT